MATNETDEPRVTWRARAVAYAIATAVVLAIALAGHLAAGGVAGLRGVVLGAAIAGSAVVAAGALSRRRGSRPTIAAATVLTLGRARRPRDPLGRTSPRRRVGLERRRVICAGVHVGCRRCRRLHSRRAPHARDARPGNPALVRGRSPRPRDPATDHCCRHAVVAAVGADCDSRTRHRAAARRLRAASPLSGDHSTRLPRRAPRATRARLGLTAAWLSSLPVASTGPYALDVI